MLELRLRVKQQAANKLGSCTGVAPQRFQPRQLATKGHREYSTQNASSEQDLPRNYDNVQDAAGAKKKEKGAMSRRLEEMTQESLESSPRRSGKMVEEAGFSEELRRKLEQRIASSKMAAEHPQASSLLDMPTSAGKGTRFIAEASPWTGSEKVEDAALRMLNDAHKPLKGSLGSGSGGKQLNKLPPIDLRMKQAARRGSAAERLSNARDRTSIYSLSKDLGMSEKEKEEMRRDLRERFQPGARSVPATIQGLQSLASERIEDAIARGLFKNIPRGKGVNVERDYTANSPFLDTTEYFMNKIIQKQEVLPPWVEKQQEVTRTAATFRSRLRNDWKRHAARVIASHGGTLAEQLKRAELYAAAEAKANPRAAKIETLTSINQSGQLQHITVTQGPTSQEGKEEITVKETATVETGTSSTPDQQGAARDAPTISQTLGTAVLLSPQADAAAAVAPNEPLPPPFRDLSWEKTELSYHSLALTSLNNLTRSYNLMAPELAKKPYFSLQRELRACFADVAPLLANEIRERARAPPEKSGWPSDGHRQGGVLARFSAVEKVRVWESTKPQYGFKEFWRDLFSKETSS